MAIHEVIRDRYFRRPKTKNERTQNLKTNSRAKRNMVNLPTNWDDKCISSKFDRSWKRKFKKKKQYL